MDRMGYSRGGGGSAYNGRGTARGFMGKTGRGSRAWVRQREDVDSTGSVTMASEQSASNNRSLPGEVVPAVASGSSSSGPILKGPRGNNFSGRLPIEGGEEADTMEG